MSESERIKELEGYKILDTLPEKEFDDIVRMTVNQSGYAPFPMNVYKGLIWSRHLFVKSQI